jgi:hypothetical protein
MASDVSAWMHAVMTIMAKSARRNTLHLLERVNAAKPSREASSVHMMHTQIVLRIGRVRSGVLHAAPVQLLMSNSVTTDCRHGLQGIFSPTNTMLMETITLPSSANLDTGC